MYCYILASQAGVANAGCMFSLRTWLWIHKNTLYRLIHFNYKQETDGLKVSAIMFSHPTVYNFKNVTIHNCNFGIIYKYIRKSYLREFSPLPPLHPRGS